MGFDSFLLIVFGFLYIVFNVVLARTFFLNFLFLVIRFNKSNENLYDYIMVWRRNNVRVYLLKIAEVMSDVMNEKRKEKSETEIK